MESERAIALIKNLADALANYDAAYEDVLADRPVSYVTGKPETLTEERLKIGTRNRMRERGQEFPEIARWRLRALIGYRSEED